MQYDEKCDPLAMLTRACNKIETDLMKSHHGDHKITSSSSSSNRAKLSLESPRSSTTSERPDSSSPHNKPIASTSPIDYKIRPPLSSGGEHQQQNSSRTPKRPHSSGSSASSSASPPSHKQFAPTPTSSSATPPVTSSYSTSSPRLQHHPSMTSPMGMPPMPNPSGVCVDPMCRDPSCPTTAARNAHFLNFFAGARVNPYFYPPVTTAAMLGLQSPPSMPHHSTPSTTTASSPAATSATTTASIGGASPFVCNWMSGTDFCGRRFSSSDDLMSHLRSHTTVATSAPSPSSSAPSPPTTSSMPSPADTLAALQAAQLQALYPGLGSQQSALAALQARAVSAATSSLSPNSAAAARYHPYMRQGGMGLPPPPGLPQGLSFGHFPPHMSPFGAGNPFLPYGLPPFPYS